MQQEQNSNRNCNSINKDANSIWESLKEQLIEYDLRVVNEDPRGTDKTCSNSNDDDDDDDDVLYFVPLGEWNKMKNIKKARCGTTTTTNTNMTSNYDNSNTNDDDNGNDVSLLSNNNNGTPFRLSDWCDQYIK